MPGCVRGTGKGIEKRKTEWDRRSFFFLSAKGAYVPPVLFPCLSDAPQLHRQRAGSGLKEQGTLFLCTRIGSKGEEQGPGPGRMCVRETGEPGGGIPGRN